MGRCPPLRPHPSSAWWNDAWGVRVKITFDNSAQAENLANFPVLIRLDSSRVKYLRTQDAGQDIRFVDANDVTVLAHEIETWNEAGSSYVWVRVPQVDASSSTDFIWMYYGNVNAADGQNATAVWSASYRGVWHLRENPGGATPQMRDSTSNGSHGTTFGGMTAAQQVPGRVGGALNLDGVDDYVSGSIPVAPTQYTLEAWINRSTTANPEDHILDLTSVQFFVETNQLLEAGTGTEFDINGTTPILAGTWYHVAFVQGAAGWTIYLNGQVEASGPQTTSPGTGFFIGVVYNLIGGYFPGLIDEPRISDTPRSAAWIGAQYESMSDTFATYGAPEAGPCCQPLTTTPVGNNFTVAAAASFEMTFDPLRRRTWRTSSTWPRTRPRLRPRRQAVRELLRPLPLQHAERLHVGQRHEQHGRQARPAGSDADPRAGPAGGVLPEGSPARITWRGEGHRGLQRLSREGWRYGGTAGPRRPCPRPTTPWRSPCTRRSPTRATT